MTDAASFTSSQLTVIITTSVTPSAPSVDLVSSILDSFQSHCPNLLQCRVIVVFDSYDKIVTNARLKKGYVTPHQAKIFEEYKENVKKFIIDQYGRHSGFAEEMAFSHCDAEAEFGSLADPSNVVHYKTAQSHDKRVTFIEPLRRLGFGLSVRSALRMTETPYVWVQQHDWALVSHCPIDPLLKIMANSEATPEVPIKYVCLTAVRMLRYANSADVAEFPALKTLSTALKGNFYPTPDSDVAVPLTPMFFWHDKPHVASTAHYLARVFPTRLAMLRGDFIEDKIGQRARAQMKEGLWKKWATWLYYPDEGNELCLRHLQGRTREMVKLEVLEAAMWRQKNVSKMLPASLELNPE